MGCQEVLLAYVWRPPKTVGQRKYTILTQQIVRNKKCHHSFFVLLTTDPPPPQGNQGGPQNKKIFIQVLLHYITSCLCAIHTFTDQFCHSAPKVVKACLVSFHYLTRNWPNGFYIYGRHLYAISTRGIFI